MLREQAITVKIPDQGPAGQDETAGKAHLATPEGVEPPTLSSED